MDKKPYISVITATHNSAKALQGCLDSVHNQTGVEVEHLIVDGASNDGTVEIIRNEAKRQGTKITWWQTEPDTGIYNAWNKTLEHINGKWVIFLGANDTFCQPSTLSEAKTKLDRIADDIMVAYGQVDLILPSGELFMRYGSDWGCFKNHYRDGEQLAHQGVFHKRKLLTNGNSFDESFRILSDDLLLRSELMSRDACFIDIKIADMMAGGASNSITHLADAIHEHRRICKIYNIPRNRAKRCLFCLFTALKMLLLKICPNVLLPYILDTGRICRGKQRYYTRI